MSVARQPHGRRWAAAARSAPGVPRAATAALLTLALPRCAAAPRAEEPTPAAPPVVQIEPPAATAVAAPDAGFEERAARVEPASPEGPKDASTRGPLRVLVTAGGALEIDGRTVGSDEIFVARAKAHAAAGQSGEAVIGADAGAPYRRIVEVLELLGQAGITNIAFEAKPAPP